MTALSRYERQLLVDGWGGPTQTLLSEKTVLIAGAGGLGAPVIHYLAAAGVGTLRICDSDYVELSNLNRQIVYTEHDLEKAKAAAAFERASALNSDINIQTFDVRMGAQNIEELCGDADILIDCLDNYASRLVLNQFAVARGLPLVHAGVQAMYGQLTFIHTPETPCLRCLLPEALLEVSPKPIVGAAAGVIGSLQALEVIKYLTGIGSTLKNQLLLWDGREMNVQRIPVRRSADCAVCS